MSGARDGEADHSAQIDRALGLTRDDVQPGRRTSQRAVALVVHQELERGALWEHLQADEGGLEDADDRVVVGNQ